MRNLGLNRPVTVFLIGLALVAGLWLTYYFASGKLLPLSGRTAKLQSQAPVDESKQLYTCGMHPNVIQEGPGTCPICGMKLMPVSITTEQTVARPAGSEATKGPGPEAEMSTEQAAAKVAGERKIKYWRSPMDPTQTSDRPRKDPMGMDYVPVYEDEVQGAGNVLRIDPAVVQNMGVRTREVTAGPLHRVIRTVGHLAYNESKIGTVNLKVDGWVEKVWVDRTGALVNKGDLLAEVYSPELVSAQEEYVLALRGKNNSLMLDSSRRKLEYWDVSPTVIEELKSTKEVKKAVPIFSPFSGVVTEKKIVAGTNFKAGETLYTIVDLSTIWVYVHIYEYELPWVREGQSATMTLPYIPGKTFTGTVRYIYPYVNMDTRDITVRLEFPNPDLELKPMMYADVAIHAEVGGSAVLVPEEAVLHSGDRQLVFVALGNGRFEPRNVVIGVVGEDGYAEVMDGLSPGELVVTSGQFMLDSESKLQEAIQKMIQQRAGEVAPAHGGHEMPQAEPVAGGKVAHEEEMSAGPPTAHEQGAHDMAAGQESPGPLMEVVGELYVCPMPEHDYFSTTPGKDPKCGMELVPVEEGTTFFACPTPGDEYFSYHPGTCPESGEPLVPAVKAGSGGHSH